MSTKSTCAISNSRSPSPGIRSSLSFMPAFASSGLLFHREGIACVAEIFPPLQCNGDVAVFPNEIVKGAQIELVTLLHPRFGEEFRDLQLAHLIRDTLTGAGGERDSFTARRFFIHRHFLLQVFGSLLQGEFSKRELHIHFHPERAQAHEVVNDLARVGTVVEKACL